MRLLSSEVSVEFLVVQWLEDWVVVLMHCYSFHVELRMRLRMQLLVRLRLRVEFNRIGWRVECLVVDELARLRKLRWRSCWWVEHWWQALSLLEHLKLLNLCKAHLWVVEALLVNWA